jgi:intracellular sulfur oxidation DsrE/DsrF family protein
MKAVFHVSSADSEIQQRAVSNVGNLLSDDSMDVTDVALVANGPGIDLLLADSNQRGGVESLAERGVALEACGNTLRGRGLSADDLLDGVERVSSGVGELVRLQDQGYAYLRP